MSETRAPKAGDVSDRGARFAVRLRVDGREVELKAFLHDMIGGAAMGLVSGLRDVRDPGHVVIEVRRP